MTVILYILLGILIGILLLVGVVWFFIKKFLHGIKQAIANMSGLGMFPPPRRVTLKADTEGEWQKGPALAQRVAELEELGFESAGAFTIAEMLMQPVMGLVHRASCTLAAVYPVKESLQMDLVCEYADGSSFTASDAGGDAPLPRPDRHPCVRNPGVSVKEFFEQYLAARPPGALKEVAPGTFKPRFEQGHAEQMDWLVERGGYTWEEMKAARPGTTDGETDEESLRALHTEAVTGFLRYWWEMQPEPAEPFDDIEHDLVIVHDELPREQLATLYNGALGLDDEEDDDAAEAVDFRDDVPAREAMRIWNEARGGKLRLIGQKTTAREADFYLPPKAVD